MANSPGIPVFTPNKMLADVDSKDHSTARDSRSTPAPTPSSGKANHPQLRGRRRKLMEEKRKFPRAMRLSVL